MRLSLSSSIEAFEVNERERLAGDVVEDDRGGRPSLSESDSSLSPQKLVELSLMSSSSMSGTVSPVKSNSVFARLTSAM